MTQTVWANKAEHKYYKVCRTIEITRKMKQVHRNVHSHEHNVHTIKYYYCIIFLLLQYLSLYRDSLTYTSSNKYDTRGSILIRADIHYTSDLFQIHVYVIFPRVTTAWKLFILILL